MITSSSSPTPQRPSGPPRHNLRTRTWVAARNHRRITAPHTRTFNHGAALVWRIRFQDERWLYVVVLLEFQSTIDQRMAVRMLTYTGLLYERLIADGALRENDKLPPVLPIVIYNGARRWNAPTGLHELIATSPSTALVVYQPSLRYFLLDHGRVQSTGLPPGNLVSALVCAGDEQEPRRDGGGDRPADRAAGGIRRPRPDGSIQRLGRRVAAPTDTRRRVVRPADETERGTHDAG